MARKSVALCGQASWQGAVQSNATTVRLWVGMYAHFLKLWLEFFPREQFLILRYVTAPLLLLLLPVHRY